MHVNAASEAIKAHMTHPVQWLEGALPGRSSPHVQQVVKACIAGPASMQLCMQAAQGTPQIHVHGCMVCSVLKH